jgi:predicted enzyme related to lactoylglutathione lyase
MRSNETKALRSVCVVTKDVARLRDFYEVVLGIGAEGDDTFAAIKTPGADLVLFARQDLGEMAPNLVSEAAASHWFLEFEVHDVDAEYVKLLEQYVDIVKPPTTQPWGIRSVWFRDPEGNLVNFFASVN